MAKEIRWLCHTTWGKKYQPGDTCVVGDEWAERLIKAGAAQPADDPPAPSLDARTSRRYPPDPRHVVGYQRRG